MKRSQSTDQQEVDKQIDVSSCGLRALIASDVARRLALSIAACSWRSALPRSDPTFFAHET
jgi:hypothetical protein